MNTHRLRAADHRMCFHRRGPQRCRVCTHGAGVPPTSDLHPTRPPPHPCSSFYFMFPSRSQVMIQQQRFGGSLLGTPGMIVRVHKTCLSQSFDVRTCIGGACRYVAGDAIICWMGPPIINVSPLGLRCKNPAARLSHLMWSRGRWSRNPDPDACTSLLIDIYLNYTLTPAADGRRRAE